MNPNLASASIASKGPVRDITSMISFERISKSQLMEIQLELDGVLSRDAVIRVAGDGTNFRQAIVALVIGCASGDSVVPMFERAKLVLLVERINGELLCLKIDAGVGKRLRIGQFMACVERNIGRLANNPGKGEFKVDGYGGCSVIETISSELSESIESRAGIIAMKLLERFHLVSSSRKLEVGELISARFYEQYHVALDLFVSRLNSEFVNIINGAGGDITPCRYNQCFRYLKAGPRESREQVRKYRLQAVQAFPSLGLLIPSQLSISDAVDSGDPLVPEIARAFAVSEEVVRWFQGRTAAEFCSPWVEQLPLLYQLLNGICPEHRPKGADEWGAFTELALAISEGISSENPVQQLGRRNPGGWDLPHNFGPEIPAARLKMLNARAIRDIGKLGWVKARSRLEGMRLAPSSLTDLKDLLNEIVVTVSADIGLPAGTPLLAIDVALTSLFTSVGIFRQLEASAIWHRGDFESLEGLETEPVLKAELPAKISLKRWIGPFDGVVQVESVEAVCLTTSEALKKEGRVMNHCVGSYDHACLFGRSAILSLIDKASGERSTVELRLVNADLNGRRLELVQHRGIRDVAPNVRLIRGLVTLLKDINSDKSQPRFQQMENECLERQASKFSHLSPLEPARFMKLKKALSKHLGYEKFRDAALKALGQEEAVK